MDPRAGSLLIPSREFLHSAFVYAKRPVSASGSLHRPRRLPTS